MALLIGCAPSASIMVPSLTETALSPRLPGLERSAYVLLEGERIYYEVGGQGSPVVLVHGIGAGNSSHLWRQNTAALAKEHRVYAFDWPGFARSGARAIQYTNDLYSNILTAFIRDVVKEPVSIIAGSLGSDYSIRVAAENPSLIKRMLLSNPTGYDQFGTGDKEGRAFLTTTSRRNQDFYDRLSQSFLGDVIFSSIASEGGLNFFLYFFVYLNQRLVTPDITQIYLQNLQGNAKQFAPFSFFAGFLEQPITDYWPRTQQPTLLIWGSDDVFTPIRFAEPMLKARPGVRLEVLPARAIPYDEAAEAFNRIALGFLR
jgi:pimeloyl-ACP methyl ester carboxylesterase